MSIDSPTGTYEPGSDEALASLAEHNEAERMAAELTRLAAATDADIAERSTRTYGLLYRQTKALERQTEVLEMILDVLTGNVRDSEPVS